MRDQPWHLRSPAQSHLRAYADARAFYDLSLEIAGDQAASLLREQAGEAGYLLSSVGDGLDRLLDDTDPADLTERLAQAVGSFRAAVAKRRFGVPADAPPELSARVYALGQAHARAQGFKPYPPASDLRSIVALIEATPFAGGFVTIRALPDFVRVAWRVCAHSRGAPDALGDIEAEWLRGFVESVFPATRFLLATDLQRRPCCEMYWRHAPTLENST